MAEQGSEITKNTTTHEQKPITAKPIEPLKPEQIEKLSDQKTTQALADETKGQQVLKKIEDIKTESDSKPEKSISEQLAEEQDKFNSYLYGGEGQKLLEIQKSAWAKARKEEGNISKYELEAFKFINAQLEKYAPKRFSDKLDSEKTIEEQRIPSYMIRIHEDGTGADYNPFHKNSLFTKEGRHWELHSLRSNIEPGLLKKPPKAVVKELQDHFTKTKAAEAAKKPA